MLTNRWLFAQIVAVVMLLIVDENSAQFDNAAGGYDDDYYVDYRDTPRMRRQHEHHVQSGFVDTHVNEDKQRTKSGGWHGSSGSSGSSGYSESSSKTTYHYYYAGGIFPFGFGFCCCFYVARRRRRNAVLVRQQQSTRVTSAIPHQRFTNETTQGAVASVPPLQGQGQPGVWSTGQPVMESKPTSTPAYRPEDRPPAYNDIIAGATPTVAAIV